MLPAIPGGILLQMLMTSIKFSVVAALFWSAAGASEVMPARLYDVTTETGMPHLEENLRYTITHEKRCLTHQALAVAFPILTHPALKGCALVDESREPDGFSYRLVCTGGHGTTGKAVWHLDAHRIRGTLDIKLGGKNMTFYQRITALAVGACAN